MNADIQKSLSGQPAGTVPASNSKTPSGAPVYSSQKLFGSTKEIGIEHEGFYYRLRITKQGKLILNK